MINLKVKCTICGKEEMNKDTVKEVSDIIQKYGLKSEHYLSLLNMMNGKCLDSDEHSFIFDETFLKEIENIVMKCKTNLSEVDKLKIINKELRKEADELVIKINELQSKYDANDERIKNLHASTQDCELEIGDSTGSRKIDIWY